MPPQPPLAPHHRPPTTNRTKTAGGDLKATNSLPESVAHGASFDIESGGRHRSRGHDLVRLQRRGEDWQREKPGDPLGCVPGRQPQSLTGDPHRKYQSRLPLDLIFFIARASKFRPKQYLPIQVLDMSTQGRHHYEATPLGLEDPLFAIEGFIDESGEHRSISGIHTFSYASASRVALWNERES
jgi:hypothetical protein